jgi:hypothetical protein
LEENPLQEKPHAGTDLACPTAKDFLKVLVREKQEHQYIPLEDLQRECVPARETRKKKTPEEKPGEKKPKEYLFGGQTCYSQTHVGHICTFNQQKNPEENPEEKPAKKNSKKTHRAEELFGRNPDNVLPSVMF